MGQSGGLSAQTGWVPPCSIKAGFSSAGPTSMYGSGLAALGAPTVRTRGRVTPSAHSRASEGQPDGWVLRAQNGAICWFWLLEKGGGGFFVLFVAPVTPD